MNENTPEFLNSASVQKLFALLDTEDVPMLRVVGGAVRNFLLGCPVKDIDFATIWTPAQVIEKCKSTHVRVVETGIDHGTVTIILDGEGFEVTTLRKDIETDGRHAVVSFSKSWEDDARRRDFTMNALYMGQDGVVIDPLGQGLSDIDKKIVRFVGTASKRIDEDALRILRFYRFSLFYGEGMLDLDGCQACADGASLLSNLSKERVTSELLNICAFVCGDKRSEARFLNVVEIMIDNNVFSTIFESDLDVFALSQLIKNQKDYALGSVLARIYCFGSCDLDSLRSHLVLSKKQLYFMAHLSEALRYKSMLPKELMYRYGRDVAQQALMFKGSASEESVDCTKVWDIPVFPLTGKDLLKSGFQAGSEMGEVLKRVEQWWIENDFAPSKQNCLDYVTD